MCISKKAKRLKNYARHALLKFEIVLAGNPFWVKLGTPNLVKSWKLIGTLTGDNLMLISQTTFELSKINQNSLIPVDNQSVILYLWMSKVTNWLSTVNNEFWLILNYSKVVWDINTKFSPIVVLIKIQLSTKFGASSYTQNGFSRQNYFNLQEGMAGTFFEPHPWNSGNLLLFSRCTNHISTTFWIS